MTELLTAAQMRAIEQAAIDSGEVTGLELMERAGRGVVEAIFEEWPELRATSHRAVVLCGPGNNGGDGFVVARLLKEWGWEVEVFLYGDPDKLPPDARVNYERWGALGEVWDFLGDHQPNAMQMSSDEDGVLVDALFGTGLSRALDDSVALRLGVFQSQVPVCFLRSVAVDMISGVCSDSGRALIGERGFGVNSGVALTVTFHQPRLGHLQSEYPKLSRKMVVRDIGLAGRPPQLDLTGAAKMFDSMAEAMKRGDDPRSVIDWDAEINFSRDYYDAQTAVVSLNDGYDAMVDKAEELADHKYLYGHALILSGGPGKGGAARLAARGALRIGAGLVTLGCPAEALAENAARLDAIMLRAVSGGGVVDGLKVALEDERINALCVGPGLGLDAAGEVVTVALNSGRSCVLDADALTWLAEDKPNRFKLLHDKVVMTPHAGEFARLFPDIAEKLNAPATKGPAYSKVDATREAAKRAGCVVLFKGPDTVIADPSGRCSINSAHYDRSRTVAGDGRLWRRAGGVHHRAAGARVRSDGCRRNRRLAACRMRAHVWAGADRRRSARAIALGFQAPGALSCGNALHDAERGRGAHDLKPLGVKDLLGQEFKLVDQQLSGVFGPLDEVVVDQSRQRDGALVRAIKHLAAPVGQMHRLIGRKIHVARRAARPKGAAQNQNWTIFQWLGSDPPKRPRAGSSDDHVAFAKVFDRKIAIPRHHLRAFAQAGLVRKLTSHGGAPRVPPFSHC